MAARSRRGHFVGPTETVLAKDLETVEKSGVPGLIENLRRESVMEVWSSPKALAIRSLDGEPGVAADACRTCRLGGN